VGPRSALARSENSHLPCAPNEMAGVRLSATAESVTTPYPVRGQANACLLSNEMRSSPVNLC
jgi:hypothetical protein